MGHWFLVHMMCVNIKYRPNSVRLCGRLANIRIPITVLKWVRDAGICSLLIRYLNTEACGCTTIRYIGFCQLVCWCWFVMCIYIDRGGGRKGSRRGKINRDGDDANNSRYLYTYIYTSCVTRNNFGRTINFSSQLWPYSSRVL